MVKRQYIINEQDGLPPSLYHIVRARLIAQGLWEEYEEKYWKCKEETGLRHMQRFWRVLSENPHFGYTSYKDEKLWWEYNKSMINMDAKRTRIAKAVKKSYEKKKQSKKQSEADELVRAIADLPPTASYEVEFDWIRSHPAIMRLCFSTDATAKISLTIDDVVNSPNGKPPSQAAVYQLMNSINQQATMVKTIYSKMLKANDDLSNKQLKGGGGSEWDNADDEDIAKLEKYLVETKERLESA